MSGDQVTTLCLIRGRTDDLPTWIRPQHGLKPAAHHAVRVDDSCSNGAQGFFSQLRIGRTPNQTKRRVVPLSWSAARAKRVIPSVKKAIAATMAELNTIATPSETPSPVTTGIAEAVSGGG